jgi:hypothetical protein
MEKGETSTFAKETKEDFFVGVVWLPTVPG